MPPVSPGPSPPRTSQSLTAACATSCGSYTVNQAFRNRTFAFARSRSLQRHHAPPIGLDSESRSQCCTSRARALRPGAVTASSPARRIRALDATAARAWRSPPRPSPRRRPRSRPAKATRRSMAPGASRKRRRWVRACGKVRARDAQDRHRLAPSLLARSIAEMVGGCGRPRGCPVYKCALFMCPHVGTHGTWNAWVQPMRWGGPHCVRPRGAPPARATQT
jgi:hypothetical protein